MAETVIKCFDNYWDNTENLNYLLLSTAFKTMVQRKLDI